MLCGKVILLLNLESIRMNSEGAKVILPHSCQKAIAGFSQKGVFA